MKKQPKSARVRIQRNPEYMSKCVAFVNAEHVVCVSAVAEHLGVSDPSASRLLRRLCFARKISKHGRALGVYWSLGSSEFYRTPRGGVVPDWLKSKSQRKKHGHAEVIRALAKAQGVVTPSIVASACGVHASHGLTMLKTALNAGEVRVSALCPGRYLDNSRASPLRLAS